MPLPLNPGKTGLAVGALFSSVHLLWSVLVALGWAQPLVDFIFWAHMVSVAYIVLPFDLGAAATLLVVTALIGFVVGNVFARIWNRVHRS